MKLMDQLYFLDDVEGVGYEEMVEIRLPNQASRYGRVRSNRRQESCYSSI